MTLTNHAQRIEALSTDVINLVDQDEYEMAHCALDDIEARVHALRRHIDDLQERQRYTKRLGGDSP